MTVRRPLVSGDQLGRYTLNKRIARGGMGDVWMATAHGTAGFEKRVVIKTVVPERADDALLIDLLKEEARVSARLDHPNLITVFDFGKDRGLHYLTMEYVAGRSLLSIMKQAQTEQRGIPTWFAVKVLIDCCKGMQYAHQQRQLVHCDLSPGNVMVCFTGMAKVVDFGVAHRSETGNLSGQLRGKYRYMAPERIKSQIVEPRGDVYSIGVILYLLLSGKFPFGGASERELLANIIAGHPRPPSLYVHIDPELERVVMRAMAYEPADRYQDAAELGAALRGCLPRRDSSIPLEDDVAFFLAALFPYADDIPDDIRVQLDQHAHAAGARMDDSVNLDEDSEPFSSIVFIPDDSDASRTVVETLLRARERRQAEDLGGAPAVPVLSPVLSPVVSPVAPVAPLGPPALTARPVQPALGSRRSPSSLPARRVPPALPSRRVPASLGTARPEPRPLVSLVPPLDDQWDDSKGDLSLPAESQEAGLDGPEALGSTPASRPRLARGEGPLVSELFAAIPAERLGSESSRTLFARSSKLPPEPTKPTDGKPPGTLFKERPARLGPEVTCFGERHRPDPDRSSWPVLRRPKDD